MITSKQRYIKWIKALFVYPIYVIQYVIEKSLGFHMRDDSYIKLIYFIHFNKKVNLSNPRSFNEKIQWLKLYDRNKKYIEMVDKNLAKEYIAKIIGKRYIIPTYGIWSNIDEIDFNMLPKQFVLKTTHDSGGVYICTDKNNINREKLKKDFNIYLQRNYYYAGREWPYKYIKPQIIAEELLENDSLEEMMDYKMMCFNGRVKCSFVCSERRSDDGLKVTFFDMDWNRMPFERHYPSSSKYIRKPKSFDEMVELAEKLSKDMPFLRVDFYEVSGKPYVGELTLYPGDGLEEFIPEKWDEILGGWLMLPQVKLA